MRRTSSASSTSIPTTPVVSRQWGSQREIQVDRQLYQRADTILRRLRSLHDFDKYELLISAPDVTLPAHLCYSLDVVPHGLIADPVSLVRRLLRLGAPLTLAYNAVASKKPNLQQLHVLTPEEALDIKQVKRAIYRFCESCVQELGFKLDSDLFTISQIFSDATGDLLAPFHTLELLLNGLDSPPNDTLHKDASENTSTANGSATIPNGVTTGMSNLNGTQNGTAPQQHLPDQRSKIVDELLQTERKYVQDLETLLVYHDEMLSLGIPRETVAKICPGLPKLVEFQRRFLVGCEYQAHEFKGNEQNFGWLFLHMRPGFEIYKTYTLGQKDATQVAISETAALMPLSHILEPLYELPATLLKPVQRILRYPLLLKEILKHTPSSSAHHHELQMALDAMHEMMSDVNETQRRAENQYVSRELQDRVKDWKGLDFSSMGELHLSGVFPVSSMGDSEQEYNLFLFERVLLCCRDRVPAKKTPLNKMRPSATTIASASSASRHSRGKSMSLELKGRIYLGYITNVTTTKLQTGGYQLRLGWGHVNDASEHGGFDIRLANEEMAQMWDSTIQRLASANRLVGSSNRSSRSNSVTSFSHNTRSSQTSLSQFGRWVTTNVGSIDEDFSAGSNTLNSSLQTSRQPSSVRNSSNGGIHFWEESPTPSTSVDALRKLSVSSTSSQQSFSGGSAASRSSLSLNQQVTPPHSGGGFRHARPKLKTTDSSTSLAPPGQRKVRVHVQGDTFLILVPSDLRFDQLVSRVERKLKLCGKMSATSSSNSLIFEYIDEDDDRVRLESDEDLQVAFEAVTIQEELSIYVNN